MSAYYYLVSGLPELIFDPNIRKHPYPMFAQFIKEELCINDYLSLKSCFLHNDATNLIAQLSNSTEYKEPAFLTKNQMNQALQTHETSLPFLERSIEKFMGRDEPIDLLSTSLWIYSALMDDISQKNIAYTEGFPGRYLQFEMRLRNIVTALSCRRQGQKYSQRIVRFDHFSNKVAESTAPDFSLGGDLGVFSPLLDAFANSAMEYEEVITRVRWNWLEEETDNAFFSPNTVFALALKFADVQRWIALSPQAGSNRLDDILTQLDTKLQNISRKETI